MVATKGPAIEEEEISTFLNLLEEPLIVRNLPVLQEQRARLQLVLPARGRAAQNAHDAHTSAFFRASPGANLPRLRCVHSTCENALCTQEA